MRRDDDRVSVLQVVVVWPVTLHDSSLATGQTCVTGGEEGPGVIMA